MLRLGQAFAWDSNPFRLPESADPQALLGQPEKSDYWSATTLGLRVDKPYAQQRFLADVTVTANRYQNFSLLDFDALEYRAAWNWHLTPRVAGTLSADRSEALVNYADFRDVSQRNVRVSESQRFSAEAWMSGGWHVLGGVAREKSENSVTFLQERGFSATGTEAGFKYVAGSGSSAVLAWRTYDGEYLERTLDPVNLLDDGFKRWESDLSLSWVASGRSALDARLAWIDYRADHFAQRSFAGVAARLGWRWQPAGRLSLDLAASRDPSPQSDRFGHRLDERLAFGLAWELGAKTVLRMNRQVVESEFREPIVAGASREDRLRGTSLALDWRALRNLTVSASLQRARRRSTDAAFAYRGDSASLGASLLF